MTVASNKSLTTIKAESLQPFGGLDEQWHLFPIEKVLETLSADLAIGLRSDQVAVRREQHGSNELVGHQLKTPWRILWEQLTDTMVLILIGAAVVSALVKDLLDGAIIMAIVVLNAALGFVQEYRAERAMAALRQMSTPLVRVRRDGHVVQIDARQLVPGDVVLVEAGSVITADMRIAEAVNLRMQEASLTGESEPVDKQSEPVLAAHPVPVGDRTNMLYRGTSVTYGRGVGIVTATGMATELGRIAELIQSVKDDRTPLQKRMANLGKVLAVAAGMIVAIVFVLGLLRGEDVREMLLTAVALAVAAVPEGLPAVVTISLALGAQRMLNRKALIRKLPAVETLGSVTVIASDKTGTLTENRMTARMIDVAGETIDLVEINREGRALLSLSEAKEPTRTAKILTLAGGALCNDATVNRSDDDSSGLRAIGDPTEGALLLAAARFGMDKSRLGDLLPRVAEVPFSSERKRMSTVHSLEESVLAEGTLVRVVDLLHFNGKRTVAFTKGAVDNLLDIASHVWVQDKIEPMTDDWRTRIQMSNDRMAQGGLRVLGVAFRLLDGVPSDLISIEQDLVFVGMVGLIDPPRPEVKDAVARARKAGIRPLMITGDHPLTAKAIAHELGINSNGQVLTGRDLQSMDDDTLQKVVGDVSVYARVSPEHKLRIVQALQAEGHITAMTGDGVNDAPALRRSDIGVAMGITGTDVSKEASDMVLLDDNFATIVGAVEEGRTIYDNVRKFIKYILTSNTGEISVMLWTQLLGMPLPLSTLQILWMNLITDGVPGLALGVERSERNVMSRHPYNPSESILGRGMGRHIVVVGLLLGFIALSVGLWGYLTGNPHWRTMVFTTLTLSQLGHALAVRSERDSVFSIGLFSNRPLLVAIVVTLILQMGVVYLPFVRSVFGTTALPWPELLISLVFSTLIFWVVELEKLLIRRGIIPQ
jgi:Ca2+-transporting ATPase